MTKLIIAEKYKVAQSFANVVGATRRNTENKRGTVGYLESPDGEWICSWAAGHVIEMSMPDEYDEKYRRWNLSDLPIIPSKWKYHVSKTDPAKSQWKVLKELVRRKDITDIYHAADSDREGEQIVREILREAKAPKNKNYLRAWYTNTTPEALERALREAKPMSDYDSLGEAADCRQKLDWLFGLNMTRAFTSYAHSTQNVGRVVSPTINLLVERQKEIDEFVPKNYGIVKAHLKNDDGSFIAEAKFDDPAMAANVSRKIKGKTGIITSVEKSVAKEKKHLYNTTQLQADASRKFGYEPDETMRIMQALYDAGSISYPRTKSTSINDDQIRETEPLPRLALNQVFGFDENNSKYQNDIDIMRIVVSSGKGAEASHTGLLPTSNGISSYCSKISGDEKQRNVFLLITSRMICSTMPDRVLDKTKVLVDLDNTEFSANGSVEVNPGFKAFERAVDSMMSTSGKTQDTKAKTQELPDMSIGDEYDCVKSESSKKTTKPPKQYTTAQLLSTMENISRIIDDDEMKEMLKDAGLGTAASRDTVIKTIKSNGFVETMNKELHPTDKAKKLMLMLPDDVKSPVMTGKMELALDAIARGEKTENDVLVDIIDRVTYEIDVVKKLPPMRDASRFAGNEVFVKNGCPKCGADIVETKKSVVCADDCGFIIWRTIAKKKLPKKELESLVKTGHTTKKIDGFKSKKGSEFSCWVYVDDDYKTSFDFTDNGTKAMRSIVSFDHSK